MVAGRASGSLETGGSAVPGTDEDRGAAGDWAHRSVTPDEAMEASSLAGPWKELDFLWWMVGRHRAKQGSDVLWFMS